MSNVCVKLVQIETFVSLLEKPWSERLPEDILFLMEALRSLALPVWIHHVTSTPGSYTPSKSSTS